MGKPVEEVERTDYGERLVKARQHAKLSQPTLARRAGMSQSNLSELERTGQGSSKTAQIAEICGVRAVWLESGNGPMLDTSTVPDEANKIARERVAHYMVGTGADYRQVALSLAAALEESGTEISVAQFIKLLEATFAKLRS